ARDLRADAQALAAEDRDARPQHRGRRVPAAGQAALRASRGRAGRTRGARARLGLAGDRASVARRGGPPHLSGAGTRAASTTADSARHLRVILLDNPRTMTARSARE